MRQQKRPLGVSSASATVQVLGAGDRTSRGTYWYDLRARSPFSAALKRLIDLTVSVPMVFFCSPALLLTRRPPEERVGFRGRRFLMYRSWLLQMLNVAEGTMSLVGPRPLRPADLTRGSLSDIFEAQGTSTSKELSGLRDVGGAEQYDARRFSVRPGVTGLWRIEAGREEELDREYVNEWSVGRDLVILVKTIAGSPKPLQ